MTTNAADALAGALLPVGGPKGYGLALVAEFLAGGLSGATFSPENRAYSRTSPRKGDS